MTRPGSGTSPAGRADARGGASAQRLAPGLLLRDLGRVPYGEAWELQQRLVAQRLAGEVPDTLLACEHEPVITAGRGTREGFLREARFPVVEVERGGQATYHGPGQLVLYPIVKLAPGARDLHRWLRALEQACIDAAARLGLATGRREGATGVWVAGERKLVSIGVAARGWVAWHGLAFNRAPDLSHFGAIAPCGFDAAVMTSLEAELGEGCPPRERLLEVLVECLVAQLAPFREAPRP